MFNYAYAQSSAQPSMVASFIPLILFFDFSIFCLLDHNKKNKKNIENY